MESGSESESSFVESDSEYIPIDAEPERDDDSASSDSSSEADSESEYVPIDDELELEKNIGSESNNSSDVEVIKPTRKRVFVISDVSSDEQDREVIVCSLPKKTITTLEECVEDTTDTEYTPPVADELVDELEYDSEYEGPDLSKKEGQFELFEYPLYHGLDKAKSKCCMFV
jgi:hypothetical protein